VGKERPLLSSGVRCKSLSNCSTAATGGAMVVVAPLVSEVAAEMVASGAS
jgi:hypothetical protein